MRRVTREQQFEPRFSAAFSSAPLLNLSQPLACATFVAPSFLAGWLSGTVGGASLSDVFTLATEFATRNMAVATAIALTLAGHIEFALFATTYFLTGIPLMRCAIVVYRRTRQVL